MAITPDVTSLGTNAVAATATTITLTTGSTVAAGETIYLGTKNDGSTVLQSVSGGGLTWVVDKTSAEGADLCSGLARAYAPSGLASGTVITCTFSATCTNRMVTGSSFSGVDQNGPQNTDAANSGASPTTAWATGSISTTAPNSVIVTVAVQWSNGSSAPTGPSLETTDFGSATSDSTVVIEYRIDSAAGSYTNAGTWTGADNHWATATAAYGPSVSSGVMPPLRIPNRMVGPMALRASFRQPYVPQGAPVTSLDVLVDASGAIGVLTLTATAPSLGEGFSPPAGLLTLTAANPALGEAYQPPAGVLTLSAGTNAIAEGLTATAGLLTLSAGTHTVTITGNVTINQVVGLLSLLGTSNAVQLGMGPTPGTLSLTASAPVLAEVLQALVGTLQLTAVSPVVVESFTATAGSLSLAQPAPSFSLGISPPAGVLSLSASAPTLVGGSSSGPGIETSVRESPHTF